MSGEGKCSFECSGSTDFYLVWEIDTASSTQAQTLVIHCVMSQDLSRNQHKTTPPRKGKPVHVSRAEGTVYRAIRPAPVMQRQRSDRGDGNMSGPVIDSSFLALVSMSMWRLFRTVEQSLE